MYLHQINLLRLQSPLRFAHLGISSIRAAVLVGFGCNEQVPANAEVGNEVTED
jgi:hypothetical protein